MAWPFGLGRRKETRANIENPTVPVSAENFLQYFGVRSVNLPHVTIDSALTVPTIAAIVGFLSRTLASLPLPVYRNTDSGPRRVTTGVGSVLHDALTPEMSSYAGRAYFWQQVFTGGRGLFWIEFGPRDVLNIWPMNPARTTVREVGLSRVYTYSDSRGSRDYLASEVIDVPFMLRQDGLGVHGPIAMASKAIQVALAMGDYAGNFFAGGGVPPLAMTGPMPQGAEALKRAMADVGRAIDAAKESDKPFFAMPPGHELKQIGFDPEKGQMTDARRFQVEEMIRPWGLPPVFVQDLTHGTFTNTEQQDLHLVKHVVAQWAKALEQEINLKVFGRRSTTRYAEHNLDGLMRGDLVARMTALGKGIQTSLITPDEARALDNRPAMPGGDQLLIQGATVPLTMAGKVKTGPAPKDDDVQP